MHDAAGRRVKLDQQPYRRRPLLVVTDKGLLATSVDPIRYLGFDI
jgi:hypothetical protein